MCKLMVLPLALLLAPAVYGAGQKTKRPVTPAVSLPVAAAATVSSLAVSPATISFAATDPDVTPSVAGNSLATVTWSLSNGSNVNWTLSVQAGAGSFTGCSTVPTSAVTVACSSATASKGQAPICSASFPLSTSSQQVAGGKELSGPGSATYTIVISYSLADSWKYVASSSCPLNLTYTLNAP